MSEDKRRSSKQPKTLHVDTLHIHANEVVFHQERPEGGHIPGPGGAGPQQMQIPRDFWGFPIRPMQNPEAGEENGENAEGRNEEGAQQGQQQGPPPGWI